MYRVSITAFENIACYHFRKEDSSEIYQVGPKFRLMEEVNLTKEECQILYNQAIEEGSVICHCTGATLRSAYSKEDLRRILFGING